LNNKLDFLKSEKSDENMLRYKPNSRCKVCRSEYREEIDQLLLERRPYAEIIARFPDAHLNMSNLSNHKRHMNFEALTAEMRARAIESKEEKQIEDITILDRIIKQMFEVIMTTDPIYKPRTVEVCGNILLRAILIKHKLAEKKDNQAELLLKFFNEALEDDQDKPEIEAKKLS